MDDSDIVEIYSAANSIEAYAMANALKADGIKAKVVNEFVQMGVGLLPLTEPVTPRVWIRKGDEVRARELLEEYEARAENAHTVPESPEMETEEPSSDEDAESHEESEAVPVAGRTQGFIGPLLVMFGIACICVGIFCAFQELQVTQSVFRNRASSVYQIQFCQRKIPPVRRTGLVFYLRIQSRWHTSYRCDRTCKASRPKHYNPLQS